MNTIPQTGIERLSWMKSVIQHVISEPTTQVAIYYRNAAKMMNRPGKDCDWNWDDFDYAIATEQTQPNIQLRLPMYVQTRAGRLKTVLTLDKEKQQIVLPATMGTQHCIIKLDLPIHPDTTYSHDGINWQPFTGNEVI